MKCPRCHNEPAIIDSVFGVLPGKNCQKSDLRYSIKKSPEFYSLNRMSRIQAQRDKHGKDLIQPFDRDKANPEFCKAYPKMAEEYFSKDELKKI